MYKKIDDYGIIGDLHTVALVGSDGSIDWLCLPFIDSPSIFSAILDDKKGGSFILQPVEEWDSYFNYIPRTNILTTTFRTNSGMARITDFMPVPSCGEEIMETHVPTLYRKVEVLQGHVKLHCLIKPRFNYAATIPLISRISKGCIQARTRETTIYFLSTEEIELTSEVTAEATWSLGTGKQVWLQMVISNEKPREINVGSVMTDLADTIQFWRRWLKKSETGRALDPGRYEDMINRSALALKLLYYNPTGAIAAAATTSLPEEIGGSRNWDYRYTWVRDTSFTLQALFRLGHLSETEGFLRWIESLLPRCSDGRMQIMYGLRGEEDLEERELNHLGGYKGSRPVRIGNGAAKQKQLDVYGEIMDAALKLSDYVGKIDSELWPMLRSICSYVLDHWTEQDMGIWEVRDGPHYFVYSKVMCWVALDRGIKIAGKYGFPGTTAIWQKTCNTIKQEVLSRGWNSDLGSFVQYYDSDVLDSSALLIPITGFLPFNDPKVISTIETIENRLTNQGLVYRYLVEDGLPGKEGAFLLCTFWLIDCLIGLGRINEAEELLGKIRETANDLGLFSEEYDPTWKECLGNFPQAFTHIGYINSVLNLLESKRTIEEKNMDTITGKRNRIPYILGKRIVLNSGTSRKKIPDEQLISDLKKTMNTLRGAFFDTAQGRVAYEQMSSSRVYTHYLELSRDLQNFSLDKYNSVEAATAFWINLYNVMVIHAVISLQIKDSVKEVRNFFTRAGYLLDRMFFNLDDIEHGVLRGNKKPPNSFFRVFSRDDPRNKYSLAHADPRIHFALVCASSSCPPIELYSEVNIDKELDIAGSSFINGGGLILEKNSMTVSLSRIFQWYGKDFGNNIPGILQRLARYIGNEHDRDFILDHLEDLNVQFQKYDWRLNRY